MISDIKRLFRHTSIYGLGDVIGRSISFLLIPLYTHYLSKADYGVMALAYVFIGFVNVLYVMGLNTAYLRFYTAEKESGNRREIFSTIFIFLTGISFIASLLMWCAASPLAAFLFQKGTYVPYVRMMALILFFDTISQVPLLTLRALERSKRYASVTVIRFILTVSLNLFFVLQLRRGVEGVLLSNLLTSFLICLLLLPLTVKNVSRFFSLPLMRKMLDFGLPLVPAVLCVLAIDLSDRYILEHIAGIEEVGIYSLGYRLGMIMTLFVSAFRIAWPPFLLTVAQKENAREIYARVLSYFILSGAFVFLGVTLYLRFILHFFVGQEYWEAAPIVPFVLLSYLCYGVYVNFIVGMYIRKKTKPIPYITGIAALVNIVLNLVLIPRFGMMGAAVATLLAYLSMAFSTYVVNARVYPIQYETVRIVKIVLATAIIYALHFLFQNGSLTVVFALNSALLIGFCLLLLLVRFFSQGELRSLRSVLKKI